MKLGVGVFGTLALCHSVTLVFIKYFSGKISKVDYFSNTIFISPGIKMVSDKIFNFCLKKEDADEENDFNHGSV